MTTDNPKKTYINLASFLESRPVIGGKEKNQALTKLQTMYAHCTQCPLSQQGRTQVVFGKGNPHASLMFVGEGPGRDEDKQGAPFVGRSGQLLTKIIRAMNLDRDTVYISNTVKCRPPQNRAPLPDESIACKSLILFHEIAIIKPAIICTLGASALQGLIGPSATLSRLRGTIQQVGPFKIMPTYHPAYLLRNPAAKRLVWEDMKKILDEMRNKKAV